MKTIIKEDFCCAFVNTKQIPIKTRFVGYVISKKSCTDGYHLILKEIVYETYPHPDCSDQNNPDFTVEVLVENVVLTEKSYTSGSSIWDLLYLEYLQQENFKNRISEIENT